MIENSIRRAWESGADEVIVSDGGSDDATLESASDASHIVHSSLGRGIQMNSGARFASGDVLLFLHADTWLVEGGCQQVRQAMSGSSMVQCGAFWQRIDNFRWIYRWIETGNAWRVRVASMAYGDQGIFVARSLFEQIGGFEEIPLMEDFNFSRAVKRICRYKLLAGPLYVSARRWEQTGPIRQTLANWKTISAFLAGANINRLSKKYHGR